MGIDLDMTMLADFANEGDSTRSKWQLKWTMAVTVAVTARPLGTIMAVADRAGDILAALGSEAALLAHAPRQEC